MTVSLLQRRLIEEPTVLFKVIPMQGGFIDVAVRVGERRLVVVAIVGVVVVVYDEWIGLHVDGGRHGGPGWLTASRMLTRVWYRELYRGIQGIWADPGQ
jgi:hypothetical protein